ncbi:SIS domain-containing protein [Lactococcus hircilactis]|uniref:SIS domain-containing protein n=1 Tax=Lactococcus hircilactis TaxID=1494462 RepID=A0A7X2D1T4_9LACT|nr:MurR/RpiR family transcriptional regulator [Lactococcus hircilactis]MQW39772.1 SIS domain-containing protein [Lactococcus hircilactis]
MTSLVSRINSYYDGLSKADQKISDFLIENIDTAARLSIQDFALATSVSTATISRYAKKIGFDSFQELKLAIHATDTDQKQSDDFFSELSIKDSYKEILSKSFNSNISSLDATLHLISEADLKKTMTVLLKAQTIGFFGLGGSNTIASLAFHKFIRMPLKTVYHQDFHYQQMLATKLSKKDCAFVISHTGRNKDTLRLVEILKKHHVPVIAITSFANSPLANQADVALVSVSEEISFRPEAVASTVSQISLLDAIFMMYGMKQQDKTESTIKDIRETIKASRL